jgi:hypothetical protein
LWNNELPKLYIYCDTAISNFLDTQQIYKGSIFKQITLNVYDGLTRMQMEKMPGENYENRWVDLMCEKMNLLEWVHETENYVLFCDADICFLGPLPTMELSNQIGLSRHSIRESDEAKFGIYNGGFVFSGSKDIVSFWKTSTHLSRYYEQAALEELCKDFQVYEFPIQNNYGWWRLLQGSESIESLQSKWSIKRNTSCSGICVNNLPLLSIHTHWKTNDRAIQYFNNFVLQFLEKLKSVEKTKKFVTFIKKL